MQLIDPPGGKPWALLGIAGSSIFLNVVLVGLLAWPRGAAPAAEPAIADLVEQEAPDLDDAAAVALELGADPDAVALAEAELEAAAPAAPALPAGVSAARATVERNLAYTFAKAVDEGSDALSATTARLFVWDLDLRRDLQKGDHVAVAWEIEDELPVVLAAEYQSKKLNSTLTAYRFQATGDAHASYWAEDGTEVPHQLKGGPMRGKYEQITSLLKDRPSHAGMDFKAPVGTEVVTPKAGTVVRTDWNWKYNGNCVEVQWNDGTLARFLHLSETSVKPGQRLAAGAKIGETGNTGKSTAPHLHYELNKAGRTIDPVDVHGTIRRSLPEGDRARFEAEVQRLHGMLADGAA